MEKINDLIFALDHVKRFNYEEYTPLQLKVVDDFLKYSKEIRDKKKSVVKLNSGNKSKTKKLKDNIFYYSETVKTINGYTTILRHRASDNENHFNGKTKRQAENKAINYINE